MVASRRFGLVAPLAFALALGAPLGPLACGGGDDAGATGGGGSDASLDGAQGVDGASGDDGASGAETGTGDDAGADAEAGPIDPCATQAVPKCPSASGVTEGSGLHPIDRCAFPMSETTRFTSLPPLVTALEAILPHASMATVLGDLNRDAVSTGSVPGSPAGVDQAFKWNDEDENATTWTPQGVSGSADADASGLVENKRVVLVSWYYTPPQGSTYEKGVRVAFVDVTNPATPTYRFALLVEPKGTAAAPDLGTINLHAGGIVWFGDRLYVAETGKGFRVFDMSRMMQVATDTDVIGCTGTTCRAGLYKYVIPEVGAYAVGPACSPIFSYVSLDRSTTPPSLLSGEYCSTSACSGELAGRVFRWPLDTGSGKLRGKTSWPAEAAYFGQKQVQGAASKDGLFLLSSSAPAGGGGAMYRVKGTKAATSKWVDSPEDLMIDGPRGLVFSLSEAAGSRVVLGAHLSSYPSP